MTRYVDRKYGLVIGSGNIFFFRNKDEYFSDNWRSIVWAKSKEYNHDFVRFVPFHMTTAQQVIWFRENIDESLKLNRIMLNWLNSNIGPKGTEWDIRNEPEDVNDCVFFRTRRNAEKFVNRIEYLVKGIEKSEYL